MTDLHSVRFDVALGLAVAVGFTYALVALFFFAAFTVGGLERNAGEAERIVRAYPGR